MFFGYAGVAAVRVEVRTQILVRRKVAVREGHVVFSGSSLFHFFLLLTKTFFVI